MDMDDHPDTVVVDLDAMPANKKGKAKTKKHKKGKKTRNPVRFQVRNPMSELDFTESPRPSPIHRLRNALSPRSRIGGVSSGSYSPMAEAREDSADYDDNEDVI